MLERLSRQLVQPFARHRQIVHPFIGEVMPEDEVLLIADQSDAVLPIQVGRLSPCIRSVYAHHQHRCFPMQIAERSQVPWRTEMSHREVLFARGPAA
jgi:hypothetical protein